MVGYNVYAMHRRTDSWGADAHAFRPERWAENPPRGWEYLPFNGGPRICLGREYPVLLAMVFIFYSSVVTDSVCVCAEQYALVEASYAIARLLQEFDVLENGQVDASTEPQLQTNLVLSHRDGVHVKLYRSAEDNQDTASP